MATDTIPTPQTLNFRDDGKFPNSQLPVLIYRQAVTQSAKSSGLAVQFENLFANHNWKNSWRNGVYDFAHYHSTSHEVLAVYDGCAILHLGGLIVGADIEVSTGDVLVIPAGVAHQRVSSSSDFKVVGAYPDGREWDVLRGHPDERPMADERIAELSVPTTDPVYGKKGPLMQLWHDAGEASNNT